MAEPLNSDAVVHADEHAAGGGKSGSAVVRDPSRAATAGIDASPQDSALPDATVAVEPVDPH